MEQNCVTRPFLYCQSCDEILEQSEKYRYKIDMNAQIHEYFIEEFLIDEYGDKRPFEAFLKEQKIIEYCYITFANKLCLYMRAKSPNYFLDKDETRGFQNFQYGALFYLVQEDGLPNNERNILLKVVQKNKKKLEDIRNKITDDL